MSEEHRIRLLQIPCSNVKAVLYFYRTKKVISQDKFKMHWWLHRDGGGSSFKGLRCYQKTFSSLGLVEASYLLS